MNARLYFGAKMVSFCIIHIGNREIFLKHPPESQLIILHVCVFSYLHNICEKLVRTRAGMISYSQKCDAWASPNISIWIFAVLS